MTTFKWDGTWEDGKDWSKEKGSEQYFLRMCANCGNRRGAHTTKKSSANDVFEHPLLENIAICPPIKEGFKVEPSSYSKIKRGAIEIETNPTKKLMDDLRINIGVCGKNLKRSGYDLDIIDKAGWECRDFLTKRVSDIKPKNSDDAKNIENILIMIMMHKACQEMLEAIAFTARTKGISENEVIQNVKKDMFGESG